jgi:hypothetical protein
MMVGSIAQTGTAPYISPASGAEGKLPWGDTEGGLAAAIAKAQNLLGESSFKAYSDQVQQDLANWQVDLQAKRKAVYASCAEERSAATFRAFARIGGACVALAAGAAQVGFAVVGARSLSQGNSLETSARAKLENAKSMVDKAATPEAQNAASQRLALAEIEMKDLRPQVEMCQQMAHTYRNYGEGARSLGQPVDGISVAVGDTCATSHDVSRKYQDVKGQVADSNSQLSMEMSRRRAGDASEARKRYDEANQLAVDLARTNARNVIA